MKTTKQCPICLKCDSHFLISTQAHMQNEKKIFSFDKCNFCESIFLINPPNEEEISNYYSKEYFPYLSEKAWGKYSYFVKLWGDKLNKKRVQFVIKQFKNFTPETQIIDFGCGSPTFLKNLKNKTQSHCIGFDFSDNGWNQDKENFKDLELISKDFKSISFLKKFNIITMWHSLEHHFHPKDLISHFYKLSSENALLIIEVPNYNSLTRFIQKENWAGFHTPRHSVIYTPQTLQYLLENEGWKVQKIYRYGTLDSYTLWWLGKLENLQKNKHSDLEKLFLHFVFFKILYFPLFIFEKFFNFGVMTLVCRK
ncbi:class I SAM-dependent methyltransferase [Silvanigrella aquatica]|uniref:Methyltransferase type 12 n=1 Tax=Silvanigrella aquatica TaxID=1915309 RepID=A0A1L4D1K1_9BACT|nr:class I SAM-dependent methyltransferase [Silvanigrella aquatica]APJ04064.1 hypothetical protein AXG55_09155 [Silvanigrella aquatica]